MFPTLKIATLVAFVVTCGFLSVHIVPQWSSAEPVNSCIMTRMWPSFTQIDHPSLLTPHPGYRLFRYHERGVVPTTETHNALLFVHGQGGGYKQGRSIGHVMDELATHFAVYTIDFGEELPALDERLLLQERDFLLSAVRYINSIHNPADGIDILAHSMGALATMLLDREVAIRTFVALSSPLMRSAVLRSYGGDAVYEEAWRGLLHRLENAEKNNSNFSFYSISGGVKEELVSRTAATPDCSAMARKYDVALNTTRCLHREAYELLNGASCDHQAVVWCNQVVKSAAKTFVSNARGGVAEWGTLDRPFKTPKRLTKVHQFACSENEVFQVIPGPPSCTYFVATVQNATQTTFPRARLSHIRKVWRRDGEAPFVYHHVAGGECGVFVDAKVEGCDGVVVTRMVLHSWWSFFFDGTSLTEVLLLAAALSLLNIPPLVEAASGLAAVSLIPTTLYSTHPIALAPAQLLSALCLATPRITHGPFKVMAFLNGMYKIVKLEGGESQGGWGRKGRKGYSGDG